MTSDIPSSLKINRGNFSQCGSLLSTQLSRGVSVILFYSPRCRYCESFAPVFLQLKQQYGIQLGAIDMSDIQNNELSTMAASKFPFQINGYPTIVIYYDGEPCSWYIGARDIKTLYEAVVGISGKSQCSLRFSPC